MRRDFRNAPGVLDAAFTARVLDVGGELPRARDGASFGRGTIERGGGILAFTARRSNIFYTTGLNGAPQMQVLTIQRLTYTRIFRNTGLLAESADSLFQWCGTCECSG